MPDTAAMAADGSNGRRAADELLAARLRLALEAAQLGLWDWDVVSGAVLWDDLPAVTAGLERARARAGAVDLQFRVVWPDGQVRWLNGRGQAMRDASGEVVRLLGTADVTERRAAALEQVSDARRLAGLVAVAQALGGARAEEDVLPVATGLGVGLLGARAAVLCVADPVGGGVRAWTAGIEQAVGVEVAALPADFPLPMVDAAGTRAVHFLPDRATALALFPGGQALYERVGAQATAAVPLLAEARLLGSPSTGYDARRSWREPDRALLGALATLTAQALERTWARRAERRLSETLQRTLLTRPPQPDDLQIAVRYQPAAQEAQVGGDGYDAFVTPGGVTTLVVGDVTGHDQDAAAGTAQVRNVLRGVAQTLPGPPAAVLSALDGRCWPWPSRRSRPRAVPGRTGPGRPSRAAAALVRRRPPATGGRRPGRPRPRAGAPARPAPRPGARDGALRPPGRPARRRHGRAVPGRSRRAAARRSTTASSGSGGRSRSTSPCPSNSSPTSCCTTWPPEPRTTSRS